MFLYHKRTVLSSDDLAQNICTNPVRVRRVLSRLAQANLLETRRGSAHGGYRYPEGQRVTLAQIAHVFGGNFVQANWHSGDREDACPICSGMSRYTDDLYAALNARCTLYLDSLTVADVEQALFQHQAEVSSADIFSSTI